MATTTEKCESKVETIDGLNKWEVENAAETITRAFEIKTNKKLFGAALKIIRKRQESSKKALGWASNIGG